MKRRHLCDVNLLLALAHERHAHARRAVSWFDSLIGTPGSAVICRVAQMGLLRLLTNAAVMKEDTIPPGEAWLVIDEFFADDRFRLAPEPPEIEALFRQINSGPAWDGVPWTDAYLAAFAMAGGLRMVTFDRDFFRFPGLDLELLRP
ncbi:MAG: PIN domain-containing protein [Thermoanaerobaculia bacterium]|nr:PIN domain-containing protein [Thermoanaerobaculia bacterium]